MEYIEHRTTQDQRYLGWLLWCTCISYLHTTSRYDRVHDLVSPKSGRFTSMIDDRVHDLVSPKSGRFTTIDDWVHDLVSPKSGRFTTIDDRIIINQSEDHLSPQVNIPGVEIPSLSPKNVRNTKETSTPGVETSVLSPKNTRNTEEPSYPGRSTETRGRNNRDSQEHLYPG